MYGMGLKCLSGLEADRYTGLKRIVCFCLFSFFSLVRGKILIRAKIQGGEKWQDGKLCAAQDTNEYARHYALDQRRSKVSIFNRDGWLIDHVYEKVNMKTDVSSRNKLSWLYIAIYA